MLPALIRSGALRRAALLVTVALCALAAGPGPARPEPVAVIAAVHGRVRVTPAGTRESVRVEFGRLLESGDRIAAAAGGGATLFFNDGNVLELGAGSTVTIGGRARPARPPAVAGDVFDQVRRFATAGSRRTGLVAMSGMRTGESAAAPLLLAPRNTALLSATPRFEWRPVEGATLYRVRVVGPDGAAAWEREVAASGLGPEPGLAYPADAPPLADGLAYRWDVEAADSLGVLERDSTTVRTMAAAERDSVRSSVARIAGAAGGEATAAARFLAGSYLSALGLYQDALAEFEALARLEPDSPGAHEALGGTWLRLGLPGRAADEFRSAESLRRSTP